MAGETKRSVYMWDETLRDGEQSPAVALTVKDKVDLALALDRCGVAVIDAGFPAVSESEREAIAAVAALGLRARVGVTVRAREEDIDLALDCGVREVYLFLPTSPLHMRVKFGAGEDEIRQRALACSGYAMKRGLQVVFIAEDTSRSNPEFVSRLFTDLFSAGVGSCIITDTVGTATPESMSTLVGRIRAGTPASLQLGIHCHDDFGLACANTIAAVTEGVDFVTATVNGIGERAGNAALEEVVLALEQLYGIRTGVAMDQLYALSQLVEERTGMPVAPNKAVVGRNAFRHESGIHTHAMIKATETYEVLRPELVGRNREWVFGKHSGWALLAQLLEERGITLTHSEAQNLKVRMSHLLDPTPRHRMIHALRSYYEEVLGLSTDKVIALAAEVLRREENQDGSARSSGTAASAISSDHGHAGRDDRSDDDSIAQFGQ